jgi:G3E family GTPase
VCVKTDLLTTLEDIARNIKPDILFIESTGAAEPGDFTSLLQTEFLQTAYRKASVICVADAVNFLKLQTMLPALTAQVQTADIILINKIDAADPETIKKTEEKITELNPGAKILRTTHGNMDLEDLDIINFQTRNTARLSGDLKEVPPAQTFSCELRNENSVDKKSFYEFMHNYRNSILRGKGLVNFGNDKLFVEIVNGNISSRPASAVKFNASTPVAMSLVLRNITGLEFNHQFQKVFNKNP